MTPQEVSFRTSNPGKHPHWPVVTGRSTPSELFAAATSAARISRPQWSPRKRMTVDFVERPVGPWMEAVRCWQRLLRSLTLRQVETVVAAADVKDMIPRLQ